MAEDLPPLTVLEEFLLLAQGKPGEAASLLPAVWLDLVTAGAVLMELMLRRRVDCDLRNLFVTDALPLGDPLLDPALTLLALAPVLTPQPIGAWLQRLATEAPALRAQAAKRLARRSAPGPDQHNQSLIARRAWLLTIILNDAIPAPRDIMLLTLLSAAGLAERWLTPVQQAERTGRLAQLVRMDLIGQAVAKALAAATV